MKNTLQIVATVIAVILIVDAIGFLVWALSGQQPVDNFYVGTITTHVLQSIIK